MVSCANGIASEDHDKHPLGRMEVVETNISPLSIPNYWVLRDHNHDIDYLIVSDGNGVAIHKMSTHFDELYHEGH